jgi:hypothetical protein
MAIDARVASNELYTSYHNTCKPEIQTTSRSLRLDMNLVDDPTLELESAIEREDVTLKYHLLVDWKLERTPLEFLIEGPFLKPTTEQVTPDRGLLEACYAAAADSGVQFAIDPFLFRSKRPSEDDCLATSGKFVPYKLYFVVMPGPFTVSKSTVTF